MLQSEGEGASVQPHFAPCPFWQQVQKSWLSFPAGGKCSLPRACEVFMGLAKRLKPGKKIGSKTQGKTAESK